MNVYAIDQDFLSSFDDAILLGSSDLIDIPSHTDTTIFTFDFPSEIVVPNDVEIILVEASLEFQDQNVFIGGTANSNDFSWFKSPYPSCVGQQDVYPTTADLSRENLNYYITVTGNNVLGISDYQKELISITPNPAHDNIHIELPQGVDPERVIVYNVSGQKIMEFKHMDDIDVSLLTTGVYFLRIEIEDEPIIRKFIKR